MKSSFKMLITPLIILTLLFGSTMKASCQNGYNVHLDGGVTSAEFAPNAIGTYDFNYSVTGLAGWPLTVRVFWQSDTYPGWHQFQSLSSTIGSVSLYSGTNDNVRYRVEFWTNSAIAIGNWTFS